MKIFLEQNIISNSTLYANLRRRAAPDIFTEFKQKKWHIHAIYMRSLPFGLRIRINKIWEKRVCTLGSFPFCLCMQKLWETTQNRLIFRMEPMCEGRLYCNDLLFLIHLLLFCIIKTPEKMNVRVPIALWQTWWKTVRQNFPWRRFIFVFTLISTIHSMLPSLSLFVHNFSVRLYLLTIVSVLVLALVRLVFINFSFRISAVLCHCWYSEREPNDFPNSGCVAMFLLATQYRTVFSV